MEYRLKEPNKLQLSGKNGEVFIGGSQEWFETRWQRESGCGPVAASNLIWYSTKSNTGIDDYINLMHDVFPCYNPIFRGVNSSVLFIRGFEKYKEKFNLQINTAQLEIPIKKSNRPSVDNMMEFITSSLSADTPVAFLSLSHGASTIIEHWHWVTIISFDTVSKMAELSDYGKLKLIDIDQWLRTSRLGGALVAIKR